MSFHNRIASDAGHKLTPSTLKDSLDINNSNRNFHYAFLFILNWSRWRTLLFSAIPVIFSSCYVSFIKMKPKVEIKSSLVFYIWLKNFVIFFDRYLTASVVVK